MRQFHWACCFGLLLTLGCSTEPLPDDTPQASTPKAASSPGSTAPLTWELPRQKARHPTVIVKRDRDRQEPEMPPDGELQLVQYEGPLGEMHAYLSPTDPGKQSPAIVWIFGGFNNGIGATAWAEQSPANDQSARQYREAGVVTMYPSFRGGNGNPGHREVFYGEVDDVIAAGEWLAEQPGIDPDRIYLGGHSTGGTLALLVAESTNVFRAVFSFGPVDNVAGYGPENLPYNFHSDEEHALRSPVLWLKDIHIPTFVFEGDGGNADSLEQLRSENRNPLVSFHIVPRADHFNVLAPVNTLIAAKVAADTGDKVSLEITPDETARAME